MALKGMGIDLVEIARVKKALEKNPRFSENIFSETEICYCSGMARPEVHFAGRFAAKEAFFKALGTGWRFGMRWQEVSVECDSLGKPEIRLSGKTADFFKTNAFDTIHLSISHEKTMALAVVVIE